MSPFWGDLEYERERDCTHCMNRPLFRPPPYLISTNLCECYCYGCNFPPRPSEALARIPAFVRAPSRKAIGPNCYGLLQCNANFEAEIQSDFQRKITLRFRDFVVFFARENPVEPVSHFLPHRQPKKAGLRLKIFFLSLRDIQTLFFCRMAHMGEKKEEGERRRKNHRETTFSFFPLLLLRGERFPIWLPPPPPPFFPPLSSSPFFFAD